jgi:hypothetical protein
MWSTGTFIYFANFKGDGAVCGFSMFAITALLLRSLAQRLSLRPQVAFSPASCARVLREATRMAAGDAVGTLSRGALVARDKAHAASPRVCLLRRSFGVGRGAVRRRTETPGYFLGLGSLRGSRMRAAFMFPRGSSS